MLPGFASEGVSLDNTERGVFTRRGLEDILLSRLIRVSREYDGGLSKRRGLSSCCAQTPSHACAGVRYSGSGGLMADRTAWHPEI